MALASPGVRQLLSDDVHEARVMAGSLTGL